MTVFFWDLFCFQNRVAFCPLISHCHKKENTVYLESRGQTFLWETPVHPITSTMFHQRTELRALCVLLSGHLILSVTVSHFQTMHSFGNLYSAHPLNSQLAYEQFQMIVP